LQTKKEGKKKSTPKQGSKGKRKQRSPSVGKKRVKQPSNERTEAVIWGGIKNLKRYRKKKGKGLEGMGGTTSMGRHKPALSSGCVDS